jgi:hypothetical protein
MYDTKNTTSLFQANNVRSNTPAVVDSKHTSTEEQLIAAMNLSFEQSLSNSARQTLLSRSARLKQKNAEMELENQKKQEHAKLHKKILIQTRQYDIASPVERIHDPPIKPVGAMLKELHLQEQSLVNGGKFSPVLSPANERIVKEGKSILETARLEKRKQKMKLPANSVLLIAKELKIKAMKQRIQIGIGAAAHLAGNGMQRGSGGGGEHELDHEHVMQPYWCSALYDDMNFKKLKMKIKQVDQSVVAGKPIENTTDHVLHDVTHLLPNPKSPNERNLAKHPQQLHQPHQPPFDNIDMNELSRRYHHVITDENPLLFNLLSTDDMKDSLIHSKGEIFSNAILAGNNGSKNPKYHNAILFRSASPFQVNAHRKL